MVRFARLLLLALLVLLPAAGLFTGCGAPRELSRKQLTIATGTRSGIYFPVGDAIARILKEAFPNVQVQVLETEGSRQNLTLLAEGKANLAILQNDLARYAINGENMFANQKLDGLVGLATLFPEVVQIITRKEDHLISLESLKGKKVAVGVENSGTYYNAQQILSQAKIWEGVERVPLGPPESLSALEKRTVDAFFFTSGLPNPNLTELAARTPLTLVPLSADLVQDMVNGFPFYFPSEIPAGTYAGVSQPVTALEINAVFVANNSLNDDDLFLITKAVFGSLDTLRKAHPQLAALSKTSLRRQLPIPLAEGARRALSE